MEFVSRDKLDKYLKRRMDEATVILSFRILLQNIVDKADLNAQLSKTEIETEFNKVHTKYGISTFRRDYVLRQVGNEDNAITQIDNKFFIKSDFIKNMTLSEVQEVIDLIDEHWTTLNDEQTEFLREIEEQLENPIEEQIDFVKDMLLNKETSKRGQCFEVTSFSILKVYLQNRGFELNRFSTVYSNDGGIDFTAQNAVYQVTAVLNDKKFQEDMKKVPLKQRIIVYKKMVQSFDKTLLKNDLVLDCIGPDDLSSYVDFLSTREQSNINLNRLITTILTEFRREYYIPV